MSFTADIKRELRALPRPSERERLLSLAALVRTGCAVHEGRLVFVSESEPVAEFFLALAEELCGVRMQVESASLDPKRDRDKFVFSCGGEEAQRLSAAASERAVSEEERVAFLRGAFLGSGSCTIPRGTGKTGYHFEIIFRSAEDAEELCELLDGLQIIGSIVRRGDRYVVYLKSREAIADLISVMGADGALRKMEVVATAREESNNENRVSNCYAGNADKSAIASASQTVALEELRRSGVLGTLPQPLKEAAWARLGNPTLSLGELAAKLGVTKSCLNHRMRKLMRIYGEKQL